jgi:ribosomal protein S27E
MDDFRCLDCGSLALVYPSVLEDEEPVACAGCGAFVATFRELKQRAGRAQKSNPGALPLSGC